MNRVHVGILLATAMFVLLSLPVFSEETQVEEPRWTEVLGSVNCLNAKKERHIIRSDCDVTVCEFPQTKDAYVFVSCDSAQDIVCVSISEEGKESTCTEPEIAR